MNTLVVYYSRTGHNEQMAQQLHAALPGDLDQIVDMKKREGMFGCVMSAMLRMKTRIQFGKDPAAYDQVVVVTPFWAGALPPATRTYLTENRGKLQDYAVLSVCGMGEENKQARVDVAATAKREPRAMLLLKEAEVAAEASQRQYQAFVEQLPH